MNRWQCFLTCILLHMLWPLMPLVLELLMTQNISEVSIALSAAMYAIGIGLSSRYMFIFFLNIVLGFMYASIFGFEMAQTLQGVPKQSATNTEFLAWAGITVVFLMHTAERVMRHLIYAEQYPEFL